MLCISAAYTVPWRVEGWVYRPQTVTHPGTNQVWRSASTLIEANALPLNQTAIPPRPQPQSGEAPSGYAYEVKAGIGVIAGNTVWSIPERLECEAVAPEAIQKWRGTNCRLQAPAEKFLMCPSTFLWCPSMWEGTTKNRVGTANSFLSVLTRWR